MENQPVLSQTYARLHQQSMKFKKSSERMDKGKSLKMNTHKGSSNWPQSKALNVDVKRKNNIKPSMSVTPKSQISVDVPVSPKSPSPANPFLIDLILIKIFGYVKKKDLPACRFVCKEWNLMIIPRFRREFEIYVCALDHSKPPPDYNHAEPEDCNFGQDNHKGLERFVKLMRTSICIPFTKFRLDLNCVGNGRTQFIKVCGPVITHLTLVNLTIGQNPFNGKSNEECVIVENLREMFKLSKNLECLHIKTPMSLNKKKGVKLFDGLETNLPALKILSFNGYSPTRIDELIAHSPNLVEAGFTHTSYFDNKDILSPLVSPDRVSTIQNLTTDAYRIKNAFVYRVEKYGLELKKLRITGYDFEDPTPLYRLIELQKDNLQEFICILDGPGRNLTGSEPELPGMKNLKMLSFHFKNSRLFSMQCKKKPFCEKFPNVETVSFYYGHRDTHHLNFLGSQCCPKLKSMEIDFYQMDLPGFQNMTEVYSLSALTSLKLNTDRFSQPEILKLIWTNLTNLQELELVFTMEDFKWDLDSIFTGISSEHCKEIKNNPDYWNFMTNCKKKNTGMEKRNKLTELTNELCISPSIANMKSLRRLSLKFPGIGLTDITGYLGVYELENLKHIYIDFCEFSTTCCESLLNQLNLESWVFRGNIRTYIRRKFGSGVGTGPRLGPNKDIVPPYF